MDPTLEKELAIRAQKDPEAFGQIFDYYYPIICRFVFKRVGSVEVAQDITSETFFQALKNLWRYRITKKPFKAWLFRIAVVQIAQYYRKKGKVYEMTLEYAPQLVASESSSADYDIKQDHDADDAVHSFKELHGLLSQLSEIQHTVLTLRYFENKKIQDIAEILGIKENTIKSHIRRGLQKLEKLVAESTNISLHEYARQRFPSYNRIYKNSESVS
jgi:RNA polymerase sigma-70 factor (ECF subfamily)